MRNSFLLFEALFKPFASFIHFFENLHPKVVKYEEKALKFRYFEEKISLKQRSNKLVLIKPWKFN